MKLNKLHIDQFRARFVAERETVAGRFPTVTCDFVSTANSAGGEYDRFCSKNSESAALAFVTKGSDDPFTIFEQRKNRMLHVHLDALVHAVVLEGANHFQPGAVAHVRQARIFVTAKVALKNAAILGAIEYCAPGFQLAHAIRRFSRLQRGHAPSIHL